MNNKQLEDSLNFDALCEAEKITGESYKKSKETSELGFVVAMIHNKQKAKLLAENNDTSFHKSLQENLNVLRDMNFDLVYEAPIPETQDKHYIFWRNGILISCDSYYGKSLNGGSAYFNYLGPYESLHKCGHSGIEYQGQILFLAHRDIREGFRFAIDKMEQNGKVLKTWVKRPFLWLLHYMDTKVEGYDYKAINEERIAKLPESVRKAITP